MKILLTGSSGFIGGMLYPRLFKHSVVLIGRNNPHQAEDFFYKELTEKENYQDCLKDINLVIHCAARAHIMSDSALDPLTEYRKVNSLATLNLAQQAADCGVQRFIFLSSVKVNGESTSRGLPFVEDALTTIDDPYGISKKEAEVGLRSIAAKSGMEVVIIRPPLVYGLGVKANFYSLLKLADSGLPLPFGAIDNQRSMVYIENLLDFIVCCMDHPAAANETFLISDGEDVSLSSLLKLMRKSLGKPERLVPFPVFLLTLSAKLLGKTSMVDRLVGNLQLNISKAKTLMGWQPPFSVAQGVDATVKAYLNGKGGRVSL